MGFNNTSYKNEKGQEIPAKANVKYRRNFYGFMLPSDSRVATDTLVTLTPDAPGATTQKIHLAGDKSKTYRFDNSGTWIPSDFQKYWIPRGREAVKNIGNQPSYWEQLKAMIGFKQEGGTMNKKEDEESKPTGYKFATKKLNLTPGYSIETQQIYPYYKSIWPYSGEEYEYSADFDKNTRGRVIYHTPTQSDTVYFNTPDNYITSDSGYMPIGTTKDQESAKKWFYQFTKWAKPVDRQDKAYKRAIAGNKNGGTMNKINYFQQGGAAPQQDLRAQVTALVQAAMQGDKKATQTVNQIMEAAKAGDQQAIQLAQMIQEIAKQMQGQATMAKWGSRLEYIKNLKFAKGGKACPSCEKGKQIEMKACGGKKAKKRYFGGLI